MASEELFPVPDGWTTSTLGELCDEGGGDIQTGPFGSQLHSADYVALGIPSIMPTNISVEGIQVEGIARITDDDAERLQKYRVEAGDIVYSRRGDVEKCALITTAEDGWLCGTGCLRVRVGNAPVTPEFLHAFLSSPEIRAWIVRHSVGATMPNLNTGILRALPVIVPPHSEMTTISEIWASLKFRMNQLSQESQTLEAIARAIFKSWFVDFDPVRAKAEGREPEGMDAATAALFPGEFHASEDGLIPKGWTPGILGKVCEAARSAVQKSDMLAHENYVGLEHIPRESWSLPSWGTAENLQSGKSRFKQGDVLFGKLRPYFHKVCIAPIDGVCSTDTLVLRAEPIWMPFVLGHASSKVLVEYATRLSNGAKMPRTKWQDLHSYKIAVPPNVVAEIFASLVQPMLDKIIANVHQSMILARLRDTLLPRLISGKLRVPEAEELVEAAL